MQGSYIKSKFLIQRQSALKCLLAVTACLYLQMPAHGQDYQAPTSDSISPDSGGKVLKANDSTAQSEEDDTVIKVPKEPDPPPPKQFSRSETQKVCAKYRGNLISVYGEIYKLENCTRHLVTDQEEIFRFARQGLKTVEVDSQDVAALPVGDAWDVVSAKNRPCSFFSKKYVTFSYTDIYFVENCVKKLIPDYETLLAHRKRQGIKSSEVLALTAREFYQIRQGRDIPSIIDHEFSKLMDGSAGVDIIPIDEACKGVEGRFVTFYSRMYKIERCRKREINAEEFTMRRKVNEATLIELRPEQWVSMPDGKPYTEKR